MVTWKKITSSTCTTEVGDIFKEKYVLNTSCLSLHYLQVSMLRVLSNSVFIVFFRTEFRINYKCLGLYNCIVMAKFFNISIKRMDQSLGQVLKDLNSSMVLPLCSYL